MTNKSKILIALLLATSVSGAANADSLKDARDDIRAGKITSEEFKRDHPGIIPAPFKQPSQAEIDKTTADERERELARSRDELNSRIRTYQRTLDRMHQDWCQRHYNRGTPYDFLERYCY